MLVKHDGVTQMLEQMPTRGFQSSADPRLHVGLGRSTQVDSLVVIWPDHRYQVLTGVAADQTLTLSQENAAGRYAYPKGPAAQPLFTDVTDQLAVGFKHQENHFYDYNRKPLMPHRPGCTSMTSARTARWSRS